MMLYTFDLIVTNAVVAAQLIQFQFVKVKEIATYSFWCYNSNEVSKYVIAS